jgi:hypothetical protein
MSSRLLNQNKISISMQCAKKNELLVSIVGFIFDSSKV